MSTRRWTRSRVLVMGELNKSSYRSIKFSNDLRYFFGLFRCGHNLIAVAGMGIALSAKAAMEKHGIPGKIVLLGTPGTQHLAITVRVY